MAYIAPAKETCAQIGALCCHDRITASGRRQGGRIGLLYLADLAGDHSTADQIAFGLDF